MRMVSSLGMTQRNLRLVAKHGRHTLGCALSRLGSGSIMYRPLRGSPIYSRGQSLAI
jgi:hypothetical protein